MQNYEQNSFETAAAATACAIIICDITKHDTPIIFVNPAFTALTGYEPEDAIGRNCRFLQGAGTDRATIAEIRDALSAGRSIRREILNYRKNGTPFWNDLTIDPIRDDAGVLIGFVSVQRESFVSEAVRDAGSETNYRLNNILNYMPGYVYKRILRADGVLELPYMSPSINAVLGIDEGVVVTAADFYSRVHPDDRADLMVGIKQSAVDLSIFHEEFRLISSAGVVRWFRSDAKARRTSSGDIVWDGVAVEITAEKATATELAFLADHDLLTGLLNRTRFRASLLKAITAILPKEDQVGVFFIDLDAFQEVNESLGHAAGDSVLQTIASRLTDFAAHMNGSVARLGGDEFALLLPALPPTRSIDDIAKAIGHDLARPMQVSDQDISIQVCVGAAIFPHPRETSQSAAVDACVEVMKQADLALHAAKQDGPGTHRTYTAAFDDRLLNRLALRQSMREAIEKEQFVLYYQPVVNLTSGRIVGGEALVRWSSPKFGMQRPDLFIPLAEASGLIVPLGAWVIKDAMRQAQAWKRDGLGVPRIAINVSNIQLKKPGFIADVKQALAETGANPHDFEFELTEGLLIDASSEILAILDFLKSVGFRITIDDFGTGYSTFKYLRDFPVDQIKIDQTFVRHLVIDSSDAHIIRSMIALSRSLGIQIVAEGVETSMQRDFLRDEGCAVGQGYLFSLPLAAEDFGWLLRSGVTLPMTAEKLADVDQ